VNCAISPAGPLEVDVDLAAGTLTLVIRGDLDAVSTPTLDALLAQIRGSPPLRLVFDLGEVGFIDCAAARLIAGAGRLLPRGQRPVIRHPGPLVRRMLELTGLDARCDIEG
jgi:anti-anti-sigma factor